MSSKEPSVNDRVSAPSTESKDSAAPLIKGSLVPPSQVGSGEPTLEETTAKPRKRDFWKLGKKVEDDKGKEKAVASSKPAPAAMGSLAGLNQASPMKSPDSLGGSVSPHRGSLGQAYNNPGSPGFGVGGSRPISPASSMIFERNVQEEVALPEKSPHLPTHVLMENHIAPALDASAEAITNAKLDPDTVEIVTHATHQPASVTITGAGTDHSMASSMQDDFPAPLASFAQRHDTETGSNYGSLDSTDVRRLSFISFADVVHAEHEQGDARRDSTHLSGHPSLVPPRSPSPIRSPLSSVAPGTSPPTSTAAPVHGFETSPHRAPRGAGSPLPGQSSPLASGSEINVETMRQALRKTGSGDLSHFRSPPLSAVDDGSSERPFK